MNCHEVMEDMQRQLDGDLNEQEFAALSEHLRECPDCAAMFERLERLSSELENLPRVTPAYSLVDAILPELERIDAEGRGYEPAAAAEGAAPPPRAAARTRRRWTDRLSYRALAGAVAAGVVAGIFLITYNPQEARIDTVAMEQSAGDAASESASPAGGAEERATASDDTSNELKSFKTEDGATDFRVKDQYGSEEPAPGGGDAAEGPAPRSSQDQPPAAGADSGGTAEKEPSRMLQAPSEDAPAVSGPSGGAAGNDAGAADDNAGAPGNSAGGGVQSVPEAVPAPTENADAGTLDKGIKAPDGGNGRPDAGITATVSEESLSPNQAYNAVIQDGRVAVYDTETSVLLFESAVKSGAISFVSWSEDSGKLEYLVTEEGGAERRFVIDIASGSETLATQR